MLPTDTQTHRGAADPVRSSPATGRRGKTTYCLLAHPRPAFRAPTSCRNAVCPTPNTSIPPPFPGPTSWLLISSHPPLAATAPVNASSQFQCHHLCKTALFPPSKRSSFANNAAAKDKQEALKNFTGECFAA